MVRLLLFAVGYSALIELESAFFKGAVATIVYRHLGWWPWALTALTIFGFAATLSALIKRLERLQPPGNDRSTGQQPADGKRTVVITVAVLIVLLCSALVHLDEVGVSAAERHAGLTAPFHQAH